MGQVKAIPEGYSTVTPFLNIKGAGEAIELYKKAFGAQERFRLTTETGMVAMAELQIGTSIVRVSDAVKEAPSQSSLQIYVDDVDTWWKRALNAGLSVQWELQNTFFGDRFGILKDKFGNRWSLAQHVEDVPLDELRRRVTSTVLPR